MLAVCQMLHSIRDWLDVCLAAGIVGLHGAVIGSEVGGVVGLVIGRFRLSRSALDDA